MAHIYPSLVEETIVDSGTSDLDLNGAVAGRRAFADVLSDGDTCDVVILGTDVGGSPAYEIMKITFNASPGSITRTEIYKSSNSGSPVNWGSSTKIIFAAPIGYSDLSASGLGLLRDVLEVPPLVAAIAESNIAVNPGMRISQENGAMAVSTDGAYPADQWRFNKSGIAGTCTAQQGSETSLAGLVNKVTIAAPIEVTGTSDYIQLQQPIEGVRMRPLGWNVGGDEATWFGLFRSNSAAVKSAFLKRSDNGATYIHEVPLINGITFFSVVVSAPPANAAWKADTTLSALMGLTVRGGSSLGAASSADEWETANNYVGPNHQNNDGVQENVEVLAMGLFPGRMTLTQALVRYLMRAEATELRICQRYWSKMDGAYIAANATSGAVLGSVAALPVAMRVKPTLAVVGTWFTAGVTSIQTYNNGDSKQFFGLIASVTATAADTFAIAGSSQYVSANARM